MNLTLRLQLVGVQDVADLLLQLASANRVSALDVRQHPGHAPVPDKTDTGAAAAGAVRDEDSNRLPDEKGKGPSWCTPSCYPSALAFAQPGRNEMHTTEKSELN